MHEKTHRDFGFYVVPMLRLEIVFCWKNNDIREDTWAATRQNLSSGVPTKGVSNQSPQLQRLARRLKFHLKQVYIWFFPKSE